MLRDCKAPLVALVFAALAAWSAVAAEPLKVGVTFLTAGLDPTKGVNGWALVSEGVGESRRYIC